MPLIAAAAGPSTVRAQWTRALLALGLAWVAIVALFWETATGMIGIWSRSETFAHCFIVPPISLWLAWRRRDALALMSPRPAPVYLWAVAAMAAMWLLGDLVAVNSVTQLALVAMCVLAVPTLLGTQVAWSLFFPLAFVFFCVPLGEFLLPQLMLWTADFTVAALRLSGVPVYREGLQFIIPSGAWSVVEACSGVRYLIASLTVGALFAYLNYQSTSRRVMFGLVALVVPIFANWLRAYMIVMVGHFSGNQLAVGVDHLIYGWVFFGVVILLMFSIGARWSEPEPAPAQPASGTVRWSAVPAHLLLVVWLAFVGLLAMPDVANWGLARSQLAGVPTLAAPEALSTAWQREPANTLGLSPGFRNPSVAINPAYRSDAGVVGVYLGYYRNQDYAHKLVSSDNVLVSGKDSPWMELREGSRPAVVGARTVPVRFTELRNRGGGQSAPGGQLVVWRFYWIDGWLTSNDYVAKVYSAWRRLMGRGDESAVVIVYAAEASAGEADKLLSRFAMDNFAQIEALLGGVRGKD